MNPLDQDTSPDQLAEYYRLLTAMSPAQRMRACSVATRRMRMMAEAGARLRLPKDASDQNVRREMARVMYGDDCARLWDDAVDSK